MPVNTWTVVLSISEELGKAAVIILVLEMNKRWRLVQNGLVIGAAIGAGVSALESVSYALKARFMYAGDFSQVARVVIQRNLLAPGSHIVWAAITGGAFICLRYRKQKGKFWMIVMCMVMHITWNFNSKGMGYIYLMMGAWMLIGILMEEESFKLE